MKMGTDQFAELLSAVVRAVPRDMESTLAQAWILDQDSLRAVLRTAMMEFPKFGSEKKEADKSARRPQPSDAVAARYGYTVEGDDDIGPTVFDIATLKPRAFLRGREQSIEGAEMRRRAVELKGNLSLADGQRVIDEQDRHPVPAEFERFLIPLTGTLLRLSDDDLYLACLIFGGSRWFLFFDRLDNDWRVRDCLACSE